VGKKNIVLEKNLFGKNVSIYVEYEKLDKISAKLYLALDN
jgi:hypothetical protein